MAQEKVDILWLMSEASAGKTGTSGRCTEHHSLVLCSVWASLHGLSVGLLQHSILSLERLFSGSSKSECSRKESRGCMVTYNLI